MKNMTLELMAKAVCGELHIEGKADLEKEATCVVVDSRLIEEGGVFVATVGERVDGHSFIPQVMEKGALCAICEKSPEVYAGPYILVKDSFKALKDLAAYYRNQLDIKIVGIIGSVGKTSTKEIVAATLSAHYNVLKTQGNFNNEVGVPLTICRIREEHEVAVVEMGISDFGEMTRLGKIVRPDAVVMTNIGPCHLEKLIDLDGVLKAKTEVFDQMADNGIIVLNKEDEKLSTVNNKRQIVFYGAGSDVYADEIKGLGLIGTEFTLHVHGDSIKAKVNLPGGHMVINSLAAAAIGSEMGLTLTEIASGIAKAEGLSGRCNLINMPDYLIVDDCYNANPKSMRAAIDLMKDAFSRKVTILGDMFELGEDENKLHAQIGEYAIENGIDLLVCVGKISKSMFEAACAKRDEMGADTEVLYFSSLDELEEIIKNPDKTFIKKNDTVLIKASHGMGFGAIVDILKK